MCMYVALVMIIHLNSVTILIYNAATACCYMRRVTGLQLIRSSIGGLRYVHKLPDLSWFGFLLSEQ